MNDVASAGAVVSLSTSVLHDKMPADKIHAIVIRAKNGFPILFHKSSKK